MNSGRTGRETARPRRRTVARAAILVAILAFLVPAGASAAGAHQGTGPVLFGLIVLVLAARLGGLIVERFGSPPVLGELLVGICLGNVLPAVVGGGGIDFVRSDPTLAVLAQTGVLILLFDVGLEADLRALLRVGWSSLLVALIGMVVPLLLGWAAAAWFLPARPTLVHVFVGATLSATSIGITARVLKDLGVAESREAQIILGAAVIDDILSLVLLAAVTAGVAAAAGGGAAPTAADVAGILVRAVLFLAVTVGAGHLLSGPIVRVAARAGQPGMLLIFGLALCFGLAFAAELVGLADIVGAFAAGLLLDPYGVGVRTHEEEATLSELMRPLSTLFVPLFFVLMGIQIHLSTLATPGTLAFGAVLIVGALVGKLASAAGVLGRGTSRLAVGIGMIPRGEVGLIFAAIGARLSLQGDPVLTDGTFSAVVLMVLVTTLLAPIGLRWAFRARP